jgi:hypothetical protein
MRNSIRLFIAILMLNLVQAQTISFQWAKQMGGPVLESGNSIYVDVNGNTYTTGFFRGTVDFDPGPGVYNQTSTSANSEPFICKLDASGNFIWVKHFEIFEAAGSCIKLDVNGNIYIIGTFQYGGDLDPGPSSFSVTANGGEDIFAVKLNSSGNFVWGKQWGGSGYDQAYSLAVDGSGNFFFTGRMDGVVDLDPGPSVANYTAVASDAFICKLDAFGNFVWAKQFIGTNGGYATSIAVDNSGNIYSAGGFDGTIDFDPGPSVFNLSCVPGSAIDMYISKLDATGNFSWAKKIANMTNSDISYLHSLVVDGVGNSYVTGTYRGTYDLDPGPSVYSVTSLGFDDTYILKVDASGNLKWAKQFAGTNYEVGTELKLDGIGGIYITGYFDGTTDFDSGAPTYTLATQGLNDVFIGKFDTAGTLIWVKQLGGIGNEVGNYVDVDTNGSGIYTTGSQSNFGDFDPGPPIYNLVAVGQSDIFVGKLNQCIPPNIPANTTPTTSIFCQGNSSTLTASSTGTISWFVNSTGGSALGSGTAFVTPTLSAGSYTYFAEAFTCTNSISRTPITFSVFLCTDIAEEGRVEAGLNIYPNPSNGLFAFDLSQNSNISIQDVLGKVVMMKNFPIGKQAIDLSEFNGHLYILKVESEGRIKVFKLLKE